jgi:predicted nucleotidyltransferase
LRGNQRYFFLNQKYPFLAEYKKMYESKFGFVKLLKEKLKNILGLSEAYIFGSLAKGNFSEASDIDLLLIGNHDYESLLPIISSLEKKLKREINIVDFTNKEFLDKQKKGDDFIKNIFSDKIIKIV